MDARDAYRRRVEQVVEWLGVAADAYVAEPSLDAAALAVELKFGVRPEVARNLVNEFHTLIEDFAQIRRDGVQGEEARRRGLAAWEAESRRRRGLS